VQLFGRPKSLAYEFRIRNTSTETLTYSFGGETHRLEPRVTVTHSACDPGKIQFASPGSWLFAGTSIGGAFEAKDKALFIVTSGPAGKLEIAEQR
jgi:hypothetical protein